MTTNVIELIQGKEGIELPHPNGNWVLLKDLGYSPVQSLAAAIGACGAYVYESILTKSQIPFEFERATVTYTRDEGRQSEPLKTVEINFEVKIAANYQERALRCLKLVAANCPVMQSLDPRIIVTETVKFN